jgi:hypothetical protein
VGGVPKRNDQVLQHIGVIRSDPGGDEEKPDHCKNYGLKRLSFFIIIFCRKKIKLYSASSVDANETSNGEHFETVKMGVTEFEPWPSNFSLMRRLECQQAANRQNLNILQGGTHGLHRFLTAQVRSEPAFFCMPLLRLIVRGAWGVLGSMRGI